MKAKEIIEHGRFLGEEFLLWLWMQGINNGGRSGIEGDHSACFIDDDLQLASEWGDVKELSLRKGNPQESREAFEALSRGMRPTQAKVRILSGDLEWVFVLGACHLAVSALKLPPSQSKDLLGRISDRLFLIEECMSHLERRFGVFLNQRLGEPEALLEEMKAWINDCIGNSKSDD